MPGNLYHCGYTATVYRAAEAVVDWYTAQKFGELAELHNQLTVSVTRDVDDKTPYVMPSLLIGLLRRIPLNTVWLKTHNKGSNCPDVENNLYMSAAIQVTTQIFGVPFKPASITTYVMQRPIAFTQEMKDKDEFKAFAQKWNASKNSMRAIEFIERQKVKVPTLQPAEDSTTRMAFTVHGNFLIHVTPPLDEIVPYDSQCDPAIVAPSWREMGTKVARLMKPHISASSETSPFMMPFLETNMALFQACVKGLKGVHYSTELITRDEKMNELLAPTIDRRVYQMMLGDFPLPLDGKVPHWAAVEVLICFMPECGKNVHVKGFTVIVNGNIFGTVDTSLEYRCPHKNCLVCVGCAKQSAEKGGDVCPACQGAMPLADQNFAFQRAEALTKAMVHLLGPVSSKRVREDEGEEDEMEEVELEEDDLDADMLALEGITNETVNAVAQMYPANLTEPEKLWKNEAAFYEKLRQLYQPELQTPGDKYSLYFTVAHGWTRTLPLHILIGDKYLTPILRLEPLSSFFFVEPESTEADFAIQAIKFNFRGEGLCKSARHILEEKNNALKLANPTGQFSTALTMRLADGAPMRTATGKLRKEFVQVPFLFFSE